MEFSACIFPAIVALKGFDGFLKLSLNIFVEVEKFGENLTFLTQRINPKKMAILIQENNIISYSTDTRDRRCPNIGVYNIKTEKTFEVEEKNGCRVCFPSWQG